MCVCVCAYREGIDQVHSVHHPSHPLPTAHRIVHTVCIVQVPAAPAKLGCLMLGTALLRKASSSLPLR